jgi:tetratricopeptide (TPR) repeat protein
MTEAENPVARADIYSILGVVYYSRNRMDLANCAVERGLKIVGEKITEANSDTMIDLMTTRATIQRYNGENARAGISLSKAAELAKGRELARVKQEVARFLLGDHDPKGALTYAEESLELAISQDNRVILPYAHELVGGCHSRLGSHDAAIHHFTQGEQVAKEDADRRAECQILHERGLLEAGRGNLEDSLALYRRAVKIAGEIAYPLWQQALYLDLARVYEELGDLKKALEQHKLAWKIVEAERR